MSADPTEAVEIKIDETDINFDRARRSADEISKEKMKDPLLIAWYDGTAGIGHPDVHECHDKPGWMTYAESRGGTLTINVNDAKYIFIYSDTSLNDT